MTAPILVFDAEDLTIGMRDILLSLERRRPAIFRSERVFLEQASEGRCLPSLDRSDQSPALDIDALRPPPDSDEATSQSHPHQRWTMLRLGGRAGCRSSGALDPDRGAAPDRLERGHVVERPAPDVAGAGEAAFVPL